MPQRSTYATGTPNWVDLSAADPASIKAFYSGLFGWDFADQETPDGTFYSMASLGGDAIAGLGHLPDEMAAQGVPPMWNTYFATDDCDETVKAIVAAGGAVTVEPMDIPGSGRMAFVIDDQGAHLGLWQAEHHIGATLVNAPGAFTWAELFVSDTDAATAFYGRALGLAAEAGDMGDGTMYTTFSVDGAPVGGLMQPPMPDIPTYWNVYFGSADAAATAAKAAELGGTVLMGPVDTPIGPMAAIQDPQGATFSIIQLLEWPD